MLKYFLVDNPLTPDPDDYRAVTQHDRVSDMQEIVELIKHRSVGVSESEIMSVLEEFFVAIEYLLRQGNKVNTPFFNINPTVTGVFGGPEESFDRGKHGIKVNLSTGVRLKKLASQINAERVRGSITVPLIDEVYDFASDSSDSSLTAGQPLKIRGEHLKVDASDPAQGVFFVNTADNSSTRASMYIETRSKQTVVLVPEALAAGSYTIRLSAFIGTEVRTGQAAATLTLS